jgi:hypothetical protein
MCLPKVIIHNSVSRDGAVNGIEVDLGLHYGTAGEYRADIHLIGSSTIISGLELYGTDIPAEEQSDFTKPKEKASLHYLGRAEYCRDVDVYSGKAFSFNPE